jgi:hypothetical protein
MGAMTVEDSGTSWGAGDQARGMRGSVVSLATAVPAVRAQAVLLAHRLGDADPVTAALPAGPVGWRVHEVLVHLAACMQRLTRAVREPEARVRQVTFEEYCTGISRDAEAAHRRVLEEAAAVPLGLGGQAVVRAAGCLSRRLSSVEGDKLVVMRRGTLPLSEVLGASCLEMLTHAAEVARVAGRSPGDLCHPRAVHLAAQLRGGGGVPTSPDGTAADWLGRSCPATG